MDDNLMNERDFILQKYSITSHPEISSSLLECLQIFLEKFSCFFNVAYIKQSLNKKIVDNFCYKKACLKINA